MDQHYNLQVMSPSQGRSDHRPEDIVINSSAGEERSSGQWISFVERGIRVSKLAQASAHVAALTSEVEAMKMQRAAIIN